MLGILRRVFSFTSWEQSHPKEPPPGDMLDASFDAQDSKISEIEALVADVRRSDGALQNGVVGIDQLHPDLKAALRIPTAKSSNGDELGWKTAEATAQVWSYASRDWAEHMPDTIPENSVAVMDITGDHWSSRWWAHQAAITVSSKYGGIFIGDSPPPDPYHGLAWWSSLTGNLHIFYIDQDSGQWVQINTDSSGGGAVIPQLFGAKGDGVANDGPAIAAALAASKHVVFPPGDYLINGTTLQPQSGSLIEGPGRLVQTAWTVNNAFFLLDGKDNVVISGVGGKSAISASTHFVYVRNSSRIKVTNCRIGAPTELWTNGSAVFFGMNSIDCEASHNIVHGTAVGIATGGDPLFPGADPGHEDGTCDGIDILYNAIHATETEAIDINWDTRNFRVIGNHGKRIGKRGNAANECIDIGGSVDGTGSKCRDGEVAFNIFECADTTGNAVGQQNRVSGINVKLWTTSVTIHHNRITAIGQSGDTGITLANAVDCVVHDNVFDWFQTGVFYYMPCTRTHVRGNKVLNSTIRGLNCDTGPYTGCKVTDNEFRSLAATHVGMDMRGFTDGDISGNAVVGFATVSTGAGIILGSTCADIKVHNITVDGCLTGLVVTAPRVEIVGGVAKNCTLIGLNLQAADIRVVGFRCQDNATTGYQGQATAACTRLFVNGWIADDSRGTPLARGITFAAAADCYVSGLHVPRFLTTAIGGLNLLTNSTVIGNGSFDIQSATLATDAVTAQAGCKQLSIDTEAAAATDDCKTITYNGKAGDLMRVRAASSARDVVMKDGLGNLNLNTDFTMNNNQDSMLLSWNGTGWDELARSDNGV